MSKNSSVPRKSGDNTFKPLHLIILGVITCAAFLTFLLFTVIGSNQIQSYQAGSCTILNKQLLHHLVPPLDSEDNPESIPIYVPSFQFRIQTADGRHYQAQGYEYDPGGDLEAFGVWDRQDYGQSIINAYTVGQTYQCWYDPTDPTQAVLTRQINPVLFSGPIFWVILGGTMCLCGMLWAGMRAAT